MTLSDYQKTWQDSEEFAKKTHDDFVANVNATPSLKAHRDFIEQNGMGFGERSFQWMWKLLIDEMPKKFTFLEIGVFCGQILSLVQLLATEQKKKATIYGISPMDERGGEVPADYFKYVEDVHDKLKIKKDYTILRGMSQDDDILAQAPPMDILYVDGNHSKGGALFDLVNYSPLIKSGGYLVIDDCCNDLKMPWGYFQGIQEVTEALKEFNPEEKGFEFVFSVVHNRIYRKK